MSVKYIVAISFLAAAALTPSHGCFPLGRRWIARLRRWLGCCWGLRSFSGGKWLRCKG